MVESLCANAQPAGLTVRSVYEELRELILADLRAAGPVDIVLLNLHGAMVAEGHDDCEGDLLTACRAVRAATVIGCELDLHCHLTEQMRGAADLIVTYKEYPHTDIAERARDLFALALRTARREVRPVMVYRDLRMINMWHTPVEPVRGLVAGMTAQEGRDGILSVSFGHGFPWADVRDVGAKMLVIADGDAARAATVAEHFARRIWELREQTAKRLETPAQALDAALAAPPGRPVVIAETSDNAGGGAASDGTEVLELLLDRGVRHAAIGIFWDPVAVMLCAEAGVGATLPLRLGGKCGPTSADPLDLTVTVRGLSDDHVQTGLSGGRGSLGPSAWIECRGRPCHPVHGAPAGIPPHGFEGLGCTLADKRIVVVKSSQHFYAAFAPIAQQVRYCGTESGMLRDFARIPLTKIRTPWWPKVADPWA